MPDGINASGRPTERVETYECGDGETVFHDTENLAEQWLKASNKAVFNLEEVA